jgi:hypothetical protein
MTMRDELYIAAVPQPPTSRRGPAASGAWTKWLAAATSGDLLVILCFCAGGVILSAAFIHMFPNFGEMAESLNIFP